MVDSSERHRRKLFEGMLKAYHRWKCYAEQEGLYTITVEGEEFSFFDILEGIDTLPLRQRQALWLICIEGLKEREAAELMGYETSSTPAQFAKNEAIKKLVRYHDSAVYRRNARARVQKKGRVWERTATIQLGGVFPGLELKDGSAEGPMPA